MVVEVTVGAPDPEQVDVSTVTAELPHGDVSVRAVHGGLRVANTEAIIACALISVSGRYPS
jgi:hypothetical protein